MSRKHAIAMIGVATLLGSHLSAQCADGSPPPCGRPLAKSVSVDPNRIAVLPFRVATADTLLGEGFAELLAPEFTGEGAPRAVDMSTTLNAWRRSGGGLRSPLTQEAATRLARDLGAGVLCQGSIVGFGGSLTITAALMDVTTGATIGSAVRAAGKPDSVDALLRQVASGLLGASGARARASELGSSTSSPAALRAYFEALALWRRGKWPEAERVLEASVAADSTFAAATYRLWFLTMQRGSTAWVQRLLAVKDHLSARDRTVVEARFAPSPRGIFQSLPIHRQAAERLVDSPEAWFLYADLLYHSGQAVVGPDAVLPMARELFQRAVAVDSQPVFLFHLMEIGTHTRDTALVRAVGRAYEKSEGEEPWGRGWLTAGALDDARLFARMRQLGPPARPTVLSPLLLLQTLDTPIRAAHVTEGFRLLEGTSDASLREVGRTYAWIVHRAHGRPVAAEQSLGSTSPRLYDLPWAPWGWVSGEITIDAALLREKAAQAVPDSARETRRLCAWARIHMATGNPDSADAGALRRRGGAVRCARVIEAWKAFASKTLSDSALGALDTLVATAGTGIFLGFENRLLAQMYEARGDALRALRAVRLHPHDILGVWYVPTLREEGRLALMARDTTGALRAYDRYLELRREAEPPFVAERDSIRALVSTLRRR